MKKISGMWLQDRRRAILSTFSVAMIVLTTWFVPIARSAERPQLVAFDALLDSDRTLAIDLTGHPALLRSASFLATHPALNAYFKMHPEVQTELTANPGLLAFRERRFLAAGINEIDTAGNRVKRTSIDNFDSYLEGHAELARVLRQDPSSLDRPEIVGANPALAQLLSQDPAFARSFKLHPGAFLNAAGMTGTNSAVSGNSQ